MAPSLNDLRRIFFGASGSESVSDAEYQALLDAAADGVTLPSLTESLSNSVDLTDLPSNVAPATTDGLVTAQGAALVDTKINEIQNNPGAVGELLGSATGTLRSSTAAFASAFIAPLSIPADPPVGSVFHYLALVTYANSTGSSRTFSPKMYIGTDASGNWPVNSDVIGKTIPCSNGVALAATFIDAWISVEAVSPSPKINCVGKMIWAPTAGGVGFEEGNILVLVDGTGIPTDADIPVDFLLKPSFSSASLAFTGQYAQLIRVR